MPVGLRFCFAATGQGVGLQKPWAMRSARSRHDAVLFGLAAMPCNICYCEAAYLTPAGPHYWGKGHHINTKKKTEHKHTDERRYRLPSSQEMVNGLDDTPWLTFCHVLNPIASYAALPAPCAPLNLEKIICLQREPLREPAMTMHALITLDAACRKLGLGTWHSPRTGSHRIRRLIYIPLRCVLALSQLMRLQMRRLPHPLLYICTCACNGS